MHDEEVKEEGILIFAALKYKKKELGKEVEYLTNVASKQICDVLWRMIWEILNKVFFEGAPPVNG